MKEAVIALTPSIIMAIVFIIIIKTSDYRRDRRKIKEENCKRIMDQETLKKLYDLKKYVDSMDFKNDEVKRIKIIIENEIETIERRIFIDLGRVAYQEKLKKEGSNA